MPRFLMLLLAAALLISAVPASAEEPTATASRTCSVGDSRSYGTTYVLRISTRNVGCRRARRLVREFHACRPGPRGRCARVSGYRCTEDRDYGRGSFTSKVRCKRGGKVVRHTYTQWT